MKNITKTLVFLFSITTFAQEIKFEKGKFYKDEKQISNYETKQLLASNSQALSLYKVGKRKEVNGGFLLGFGLVLIAGDLVNGLTADIINPSASAFTYAGLGAIAISIPILSGRNEKIKQSIDLYNNGLKSISEIENNLKINVISNKNGYGIQILF